jgi:glycosyltransferase involved in cell wall biosynthesis
MNIFVFGTRGIPDIQGGVEQHCERLYPLLSHQYIITIFRRSPYIDNKCKNWNNIRFVNLPSTKIKGFEAFFHSFLCAIICIFRRPDIVHIHNIGPGIWTPLLRLFKIKVVLTYHSPNYEHAKWNFFAKNILRLGEYLALRYASYVIFVSQKQREKFTEKIMAKSVWIPNGVLQPTLSIATDYIESLGVMPQKYILAVGRITQEKGFDYLIKAYNNLHCFDHNLIIAGGIDHVTTYSKQIIKMATENNVILTGFVLGEKLRQLYSHAKAFVLPSSHEGLPIALLEAMSYSLPVIASNIPANTEIGLPPECYFQVNDERELAERLKEIIKTPFQQVVYNMEKYDWNCIAKQTIEIYEQINRSPSQD